MARRLPGLTGDLAAARACGRWIAFVGRREYGEGQTDDIVPTEAWGIVAADFIELAERLTPSTANFR